MARRKLDHRASNGELLEVESPLVAELKYYHQGYMDGGEDDELMGLRYFSLLDTKEEDKKLDRFDGVWLAGRMSIDRRIHSTDVYATWVIPLPVYDEPDPSSSKQIVEDYSLASGLWVGRHEGKYIAIGGQDVREVKDDGVVVGTIEDDRDGLRVLEADSFSAMISNASWLHPLHASRQDPNIIIQGDHPGCTTERHRLNHVCEFDGKTSAVFFHNRWYVYHRANVKPAGGRFVQVAISTTSSVYGPYGPLQLISLAGYDPYYGLTEWSNIYYMVVNVHPWDESLLIALMPVNFGEEDVPNGDGDASIRMSFSCNGLNWSEMIFLTQSFPKLGRTYDHPVDGFILHNGNLHWYMHRDVPNISPSGEYDSAVVEYMFRKEELMRLSSEAKAALGGCEPSIPAPPSSAPFSAPPPPPTAHSPAVVSPLSYHAPLSSTPSYHAPLSSPTSSPPPTSARPAPRPAPPRGPEPLRGTGGQLLPSQQLAMPSSSQLGVGLTLFAGLVLTIVGIRRWTKLYFSSSSLGQVVELTASASEAPRGDAFELNDAALAAAKLDDENGGRDVVV